jgi:translation initiation factor IF-3
VLTIISCGWSACKSAGDGHVCFPIRKGAAIPPADQKTRINEQIRISPVRVIGADGAQLGIMPVDSALSKAREADLDLVEVAPTERPPVCRIMDYGKFKYQQNQKSSHTVHHPKLKEIRLRPKTEHKDKVQVSVIFRGRELAHIDEGRKVMDQVIAKLLEVGKLESPPSLQQKRMIATVIPKQA